MTDLAAINAALALGDPAIPPVGAWVLVASRIHVTYRGKVVKPPGRKRGREHFYLHYVGGGFDPREVSITIVSLPDNAPPFEQWRRVPKCRKG